MLGLFCTGINYVIGAYNRVELNDEGQIINDDSEAGIFVISMRK